MVGENRIGYWGILSCITVYAYSMFFSFFSLLGIKYQAGYLEIFSIALLLLTTIGIVWKLLHNHKVMLKECLIYTFIILILLFYLFNDTRYGHNETAQDTIESFVARSVPALFCGIIAAEKRSIRNITRAADLVLVFFTLCCAKLLFLSLSRGISSMLWANELLLDYQNASYVSSYTFGIALYKLFVDRESASSLKKRILYITSIIICSLTAIFSGGRGGVVVILSYLILLFLYIGFVQRKAPKLFGFLAFAFITIFILNQFLSVDSNFLLGFNRVFEFLGPKGGINWEGTSGRLKIYIEDWELFTRSPIWGYGVCGAPFNGIIRTHNIIFDILIDGGIIYLLVWIGVCWSVIKHCLKRLREDTAYGIILVFFVGEFTMLLFSNVYMRTSAIWFAIAFSVVDSAFDKSYNYSKYKGVSPRNVEHVL